MCWKKTGLFMVILSGSLMGTGIPFTEVRMPEAFARDRLEDLLREVKIPTLPLRSREALDFLVAQKGFKQEAHQVVESLQSSRPVVFSFQGGATYEPILHTLNTVNDLTRVQNQVKQQQYRDRFRPDFSVAKSIWQQRLPALKQSISASRQTLSDKGRQLIKEEKDLRARQKQLGLSLGTRQKNLEDLTRRTQDKERVYQQDLRDYKQLKYRYDDIQDQLSDINRQIDQDTRELRSIYERMQRYEQLRREAERLIFKDSKNAKIHRQNVQKYLREMARLEQRIRFLRQELQRLEDEQETLQRREDREERRLAERRRLKNNSYSVWQTEYEAYSREKSAVSDLMRQQTQTQKAIASNEQEQAVLVDLLKAVIQTQEHLAAFTQGVQSLNAYAGFQSEQDKLKGWFASLRQLSLRSDYQQLFQQALYERVLPLEYLLKNMQKPVFVS